MPPTTLPSRLRVIGQELQRRKAVDFEVSSIADGLHVSAAVPPAPPAASEAPRRGWKLFRGRSASPSSADAEPVPWEQDYSWSDLERLDAEYRAQRQGTGGAPDEYATSQVLRVVGAFAESHRWTVLGVKRDGPFLEIRHQDRSGEPETWSEKYAELYDFAFRLRSRRAETADHA